MNTYPLNLSAKKIKITYIGKEISPNKSISMPKADNVSVEVGVDAVGVIILVSNLFLNIAAAVLGIGSIRKISNTAQKDISTRIKPQDLEQNKEIEAYMNRIIGTSNASRVTIALFTNGSEANMFSFKYFSILWEACNHGITETKANYQKVPIVKIKTELQKCFLLEEERLVNTEKKFAKYKISDDLPDTCRNYLIKNNIQLVLSRLIGNEKQGYLGIINIQFSHDTEIPRTIENKLEELFLSMEPLFEKKTNKRWFPFF